MVASNCVMCVTSGPKCKLQDSSTEIGSVSSMDSRHTHGPALASSSSLSELY